MPTGGIHPSAIQLGARPALIIQNDIGNRYSPVTIVAAITSKLDDEPYPIEVPVSPPEGGLRAVGRPA